MTRHFLEKNRLVVDGRTYDLQYLSMNMQLGTRERGVDTPAARRSNQKKGNTGPDANIQQRSAGTRSRSWAAGRDQLNARKTMACQLYHGSADNTT